MGGVSVAQYVAENPEKLKADVALVSDTSMYAPGMPTLDIGLRGLIYMEIESQGPARDLHSGVYGGAAPNAVFGLIEFLAKVKNSRGQIKVPGFYDDVAPPAPSEKESWAKLPFSEKKFLKEEVGSTKLTGEPGFSVLERTWARPTFEVHGIGGGFTGPGSKTVIPAKAVAKCSFRLVPNQDPDKIVESFRAFIKKNTPKGITAGIAGARRESRADGESRSSGHPRRLRRRSAISLTRRRCSRGRADPFRLSAISPRT